MAGFADNFREFAFQLHGTEGRGHYSTDEFTIDDGVARKDELRQLGHSDTIFVGASPLLPLEAMQGRADRYRLIVLPSVGVRDIPEFADTGASARDQLGADELFKILGETNPDFREHLLLPEDEIRKLLPPRSGREQPWQRVQSLLDEAAAICPIDVDFASESGLRIRFLEPVSIAAARSMEKAAIAISPDSAELVPDDDIALCIVRSRTLRLWWD